jgi:hypothetical protein
MSFFVYSTVISSFLLKTLLTTQCGHRSFVQRPHVIDQPSITGGLYCESEYTTTTLSYYRHHRGDVVQWRGWNGLKHRQELQFKNSPVLFIKTFYYRWIVAKQSTGLCSIDRGTKVQGEVAARIFGFIQWRRRWPCCQDTPCWENVGQTLFCKFLFVHDAPRYIWEVWCSLGLQKLG